MRKPNPAKAAAEAQSFRLRAARARDAAGRFNRRLTQATGPDPALAVVALFTATWTALERALDAEVPDDLVAELEDADGAAYERLKCVRPTTPEGYRALAECWAMVLKGHRGDEPGIYASDHAADSLIAAAGACVPVQALDCSILGQVDLASATLNELEVIREKMYALSDLAYGMAAQECCKATNRDPRANPYNAAGALMQWLADELTTVEDSVGAELQRRQPTDFWDRRTRLAAVAERVIKNGDDAETAALIRDLTAFAAEQAEH